MKKLLLLPLLMIVMLGQAQNLGNLLKKGKDALEKTGVKDKLKETASDMSAANKAKLDSADFQFAISVNDNAGFFDVGQKGELLADAANMFKLEKTKAEKLRDSLDLAIFAFEQRRFKVAEQNFLKLEKSIVANSLTAEIIYLKCLSNLGLVYLMKGQLEDAGKYLNTALELAEKNIGKNSPAYAVNLNNVAKLNQQLGKFNEAETQFEAAHQILLKLFGETSMQNAIVENNKAMLLASLGRTDLAVESMKAAIKAMESAPKKISSLTGKSFDNRKFQVNLALIYQLSGKYTEAEASFISIKKVFETRGEVNNPEYAGLLNQLAILYIQMNKVDDVEKLLKKSAEVYKKRFTEENTAFAKVQNDLGIFYRMQGRFAESETALKKALDLRQSLLGADHPDYVKTLENLGLTLWKKGDLQAAYPILKEGLEKTEFFIHNYFQPMSEAEKTKYWETLQPRFQRFYNFALDYSATNPAVLTDMLNAQIATKALLLNSTNKVKKTILASGNKALIENYVAWIGKKEALSHYYSLTKEELAAQKLDLKALEKETNDLERTLASQSGVFSEGYVPKAITMQNLVPLLKDDEALVELARVRTFDKDFTDQARYVALVLTKGASTPKAVVLQNGQQLETRYARYYKNAAINKMDDAYSYDQFWAPLDAAVAGKKTLYLSPDGVYNQINVNTLRNSKGEYLIGRYDVITVGNSKDIIRLKQSARPLSKKDAFLLGFPDYGGTAVSLPGTKAELDAINKILKSSGFATNMKQEKEASEKNLKTIKAPSLMHIATHGYFMADASVGQGSAFGVNAENARNNPLLRSGLILANPSGQKQDTTRVDFGSTDNGVLTAYEAMNLDLEGTDLIVLSACETGLGDVRAGEGVYGLQRAFLVAGAGSLIMSLWKVDDAATQQLITSFYGNWVKTGNKFKAFKQAQQQLMTQYKNPYYWGAFVMLGM